MHKCRDDGNCKDGLRDHHRSRREEQAQGAQGTGARKRQIKDKAINKLRTTYRSESLKAYLCQ